MIFATASPLWTVIIGGIAVGFNYAILVLGVLLVFQVGRVINFAYGQFGAIAALVAYLGIADLHLSIAIAVVMGVLASVALSAATEVTIISRLGNVVGSGRDLLVTLGLLLFLEAGSEEVFGVTSHPLPGLGADTTLRTPIADITIEELLAIGLGIVLIFGIYFLLHSTDFGLKLRSASYRPEVAESVGINVLKLRIMTWALAGVMGALGAILFANQLSASPDYMTTIIITVFVLALLGGPDKYWAPLLVSILYGTVISIIQYYYGANSATPATFVIAIVVLLMLPARLVSGREAERA